LLEQALKRSSVPHLFIMSLRIGFGPSLDGGIGLVNYGFILDDVDLLICSCFVLFFCKWMHDYYICYHASVPPYPVNASLYEHV
jgi:hypothetical protein